jgi:2-aminoadipate transaminase
LLAGERLPATRELAGQLGLNRTTVSAAYAVLEEAGLLRGEVGRGSFVAQRKNEANVPGAPPSGEPDALWRSVLGEPDGLPAAAGSRAAISFASSRPAEDEFPMDAFRRLAREVIDSPEAAAILQLGSPYGYEPLRRYLLDEARRSGAATSEDDLLITNGCQQALDLLSRVLVAPGTPVAVEDPVYHGLLSVFGRAGARLLPVPVGEHGLNVAALESVMASERPRLLITTPNFQNPTGTTLSQAARNAALELAQRTETIVIESDIYSDLRYEGAPAPSLKQLDSSGRTVLLGSYSKVAFPGLRVGWVIGPRPLIARLAEAKQISDLHSDQLAQAVLLRFAESGELKRHLEATRRAGALRLRAVLEACERHLPRGSRFTRPQGGMNLWVELPAPLESEAVLRGAEERGVNFLPGIYFGARREHRRGLRLSFGGLRPQEITRGVAAIGEAAAAELAGHRERAALEPVAALV